MSRPDIEDSSQSSVSSPRSLKASIASEAGQTSQTSLSNELLKELTPPSSVASEHDLGDTDATDFPISVKIPDHANAGKKRSADGQIKDQAVRHSRNLSTLSNASTSSLAELTESLKTKLSYAMLKVQHGWQNNSLDEVETLASASPYSPRSQPQPTGAPHLSFSPRANMTAMPHDTRYRIPHQSNFGAISADQQPGSRSLAPPATITPAASRRAPPSSYLRVNTARYDSQSKPKAQQRTPSQNAAMEADAVETLLFMSASPSASGHFPPLTSPLREMFARGSPRQIQLHTDVLPQPTGLNKVPQKVDRACKGLDDTAYDDVQQALSIMEAHRAAQPSI